MPVLRLGGAGPVIDALVAGWFDPNGAPKPEDNQYAAATVGQLKAVAKPFYDRLIALGYLPSWSYPWDLGADPAENYALVTAGQVKHVFAFEIPVLAPLVMEALYYQQDVEAGGKAPFGISVKLTRGGVPQTDIPVTFAIVDSDGSLSLPGGSEQSALTASSSFSGLARCDFTAPTEPSLCWVEASAEGVESQYFLMDVADGGGDNFTVHPPGNPSITFQSDSDGDGYSDSVELALGTLARGPGASDSRPPDEDEDGVPDALDAVPYDPNFKHAPSPSAKTYVVIDVGSGTGAIKNGDYGSFNIANIMGRNGDMLWNSSGTYHFRSNGGQEATFTLAGIKAALGGASSLTVTSVEDVMGGMVCGRMQDTASGQWGYVYDPVQQQASVLASSAADEHFGNPTHPSWGPDAKVRAAAIYLKDGYAAQQTCVAVATPPNVSLPGKAWDAPWIDYGPGDPTLRPPPGPNDPDLIPIGDVVYSDRSVFAGGRVVEITDTFSHGYDEYNPLVGWERTWDSAPYDATDDLYLVLANGAYLPFMSWGLGAPGMVINHVSDHPKPWVVANDPWELPDPLWGVVANRIWQQQADDSYAPAPIYGSKEQYEAHHPLSYIYGVNAQGVGWVYGTMADGTEDEGVWANGEGTPLKTMVGASTYAQYSYWEFKGLSNQGTIAMTAHRTSDNSSRVLLLVPIGLVDSKDATLDNGNDVMVQPIKDDDDKNPQTVAWIDPHGAPNEKDPEMPWLVLRVWGAEQMGLKIKWKLKVEYKRPNGRKLDEDKIEIPDAIGWVTESLDGAVEIYDNTKWKNEITQKGFFGGDAEVTFQLLKADGSALGEETKWEFYIGGKNPDDEKTKTFITETATTVQQPMAWFVYAIAKHESKDYNGGNSRYNQFWDTSGRFAKVHHHGGEVLWVDNPGEDPPKGFGMFQVTGNKSDQSANIPRKQLWNWQDNVRGGLDIIASKRGIADRYFARIQRRSAAHKAAYQADPPPNIPVGSHTFSSADAIQIYGYNGTGSYNGKPATIDIRYPFDPNKPPGLGSTKRWFWNPHNVAGGEPYIRKIERELE